MHADEILTTTNDDGSRKSSERDFHNLRYGGDEDPRAVLGRWYAAVDPAFQRQNALIRQAPAEAKVLE